MKQIKLGILAASIVAAFATNVAYAGQIQASSTSIAREVITSNTQTITAPSMSYRFAGDVDARVQTQTFQIQFVLSAGTWASAPAKSAISLTDGLSGSVLNQGVDYDVVAVNSYPATNPTTVWATITVYNTMPATGVPLLPATGAVQLVHQPLVSINVSSNTLNGVVASDTSTVRGTLSNLATVVGSLASDFSTANPSLTSAFPASVSAGCSAVKNMSVFVHEFDALSSPSSIAVAGTNGTEDESVRSGATNTATIITFPTNIVATVAPSTGTIRVNTAAANLDFSFTVPGTSYINPTLLNLGTVQFKQASTGYDSDLTDVYSLLGGLNAGGSAYPDTGVPGTAAAAVQNGTVEASSVAVTVYANNGFVPGSSVFLSTSAVCATPVDPTSSVLIGSSNAAGPVTLSVATADLNAALGNVGVTAGQLPLQVCYSVPGTGTAIPDSAFEATATLVKASGPVADAEQNNECGGPLLTLSGGIKIDVRNYANSKDPNGWYSVIRLINNSESRAVDVWGQIINQDGTYGPYGLLTANLPGKVLPARGVLNLTAAQLDPLLNLAPTATDSGPNTIGTAYVNGGAPRLRITSISASTLRVQNYLYNPSSQNFIEASGSEGVDFDGGVGTRAASTSGLLGQDAQAGLNGN